MAICPRLRVLLDASGVKYEVLAHSEAFTARAVAASAHVASRKVAKVVVVRDAAGSDLMAVLPASHHFDRYMLRHATGRTGIQLENEDELLRLFPDCEVGAMPPFGHLYGLSMYLDPCLAEEADICFQAGNHRELIRMRYEDFARLAEPFFSRGCLHQPMTEFSY